MLAATTVISSTLTLWAGVIAGVICPPFISFLKNENWSNATKQILSMAVSLVAGVLVIVIAGGGWSASRILTQSAVILAVATSFYKMYFQSAPWEAAIAASKAKLTAKK